MRVAVLSARPYDIRFLTAANVDAGHELTFLETRLSAETVELLAGFEAVCTFVNDSVDRAVLEAAAARGVRLVAQRAAGFNNIDLRAAHDLGVAVGRVPEYSPHAVAEHTLALILTLNRKIHRAYNRVREGNFALEGLLGFDMCGRTAGVVGTGAIGEIVARLLIAFGCTVVASDPRPSAALQALGVRYVAVDDLLPLCDIVTLHCPLTAETRHLIDRAAVRRMKPGAMLVNTSRGAVIDTRAVIAGLKSGAIGHLGIDVYEEEADLFFDDHSAQPISDDVFARLLTFPNVVVTGHQGFFTVDALTAIAETTIRNISDFESNGRPAYPVTIADAG